MNELKKAKITTLKLLDDIKTTLRRSTGNEMKLLKFHVLRHLIDDIDRFGCPQNFDGGPCEANFKPQKHMAQLTQRRHHTFKYQMGNRLSEHYCFTRAINETGCQYMNMTVNSSTQSGRKIGGSKFTIQKSVTDIIMYSVHWLSVKMENHYPQHVLKYIYEKLYDEVYYPHVTCFTEHKRQDFIFHGVCQYRSDHEWYDWAVINWEGGKLYLGKIYCFVDMTESKYVKSVIVNGNEICQGQVYAVISSLSEKQLRNYKHSKLFSRGIIKHDDEQNEVIYLVSVDAIANTAFVIPNIGSTENEVLVMLPRKCWSSMYIFE